MKITRVLTFAEYVALGEDAVARGFYRNDRRIFTPGMAWPQPWYFDPLGELARSLAELPSEERSLWRDDPMFKSAADDLNRGRSFLSPHYWRDWSTKRAPICVVCPNGEEWEIDRRSSNGDGWKVEGDLPNITCTPSIVVRGYHGFLRGGEFTADIEGRGPNGTPQ